MEDGLGDPIHGARATLVFFYVLISKWIIPAFQFFSED